MTTARVQLRGMRIEIDDAGMLVERDGVVYALVWRGPPMPTDPAPPPAECEPDDQSSSSLSSIVHSAGPITT